MNHALSGVYSNAVGWLMAGMSVCLFGLRVFAAEVAVTSEPALNPALPTIFIVGDSTAAHRDADHTGWGMPFPTYFDLTKVNIANRARGGRSSKTFLTEGLWDGVQAEIKAGDFVLLQFGHNDGGSVDKEKARGSLPGVGEEAKDVTMPNGQKETVHSFGWYLRKYIADTKAKGATAVVISPTIRNIWHEGRVEPGIGHYAGWAAEIAKAQSVDYIDLTRLAVAEYEERGEEPMKANFPKDHTHTNAAGAELNAALIVAEWKRIPDVRVTANLSPKGKDLKGPPPEKRALPLPADPKLPSLFLIGDSTVRNGQGDGRDRQWGWGEPLAAFFDSTRLNVVNRAVNGASSRTYTALGYWEHTLSLLKAGDFVLIQFGHNDGAELNDTTRARGTIRGVGDEVTEIDNLLTKRHEIVHSFGWYLRNYTAEIRAKGATPIICSLVPRETWQGQRIVREDYADWAVSVAKNAGVAFIDLNARVAGQYEQLGVDRVKPLFAAPPMHTSLEGAQLNAESVIAALKAQPTLGLNEYFSAKAKAAPTP